MYKTNSTLHLKVYIINWKMLYRSVQYTIQEVFILSPQILVYLNVCVTVDHLQVGSCNSTLLSGGASNFSHVRSFSCVVVLYYFLFLQFIFKIAARLVTIQPKIIFCHLLHNIIVETNPDWSKKVEFLPNLEKCTRNLLWLKHFLNSVHVVYSSSFTKNNLSTAIYQNIN